VLRFSGRTGLVAATATFVVYAVAREVDHASLDEARTAATIVLLVVGLWVLAMLARPFTRLRGVLLAAMAAAFVGALTIPPVKRFFALEVPPARVLVVIALTVAGAGALLELTRFRSRR
jgi:cation-transporting ATPase E/undecaprenyl-diphosphatase